MSPILFFAGFLLSGCDGSEATPTDCLRPLDWRDALIVEEGSTGSVVVVEDCDNDLTVTEVDLVGAGWDGDLPAVGDKISAGTWTIEVFFSGSDFPGEYTGLLTIEADGLDPEPAKEIRYVILGDSGDSGGE